ncbi:MAG: 23S rRNA (guanosine(2251)-2'-O)-methyltransferase RlmB, partial [Dehalococcoidia bacterium]|nr:23S rRNA (guanosine(2251)-2'-O)-methyltransferase RlmB [Dehalococcoidia bacterium]
MPVEMILGRHAVVEALRGGREVKRLLVTGSRGAPDSAHSEALQLARARGVVVRLVGRKTLDRLGSHHQGIAAEVAAFPYQDLETILASVRDHQPPPLLLVLDSVQDPQNLGTLMRTAAALGANAVILPKHRSANVTPAVERASAGAVSRLAVGRVTNLARAIEAMRNAGIWVYGLDARAS